jgi:hypothetical protein
MNPAMKAFEGIMVCQAYHYSLEIRAFMFTAIQTTRSMKIRTIFAKVVIMPLFHLTSLSFVL